MLKIGVTGGIGSGKSTVCKVFASLGIPIYDSDKRAKELMVEDELLKQEIINEFGELSYLDGSLNRGHLSSIVFNNPKKLMLLNSLVHPAVGRDFQKWMEQIEDVPYCVKEAALLFEAGSYKSLDRMVHVDCPKEERIRRVVERDGVTSEEVSKRINNQWPDERKQELSDYQIDNSGKELLIPQVLKLHKQLLALSNA